MIIFLACLCALGTLALIAQTFVFKWIFDKDHTTRKKLTDELKALQKHFEDVRKSRELWYERCSKWMERFKGLEELSAETGEQHKKQIAELQRSLDEWKNRAVSECDERVNFAGIAQEYYNKMTLSWHAHQVVKKGKQVICLTAIVEASDGPGAVAAFEVQMKEVKAKMRIRSKAPVFAKTVFPNF